MHSIRFALVSVLVMLACDLLAEDGLPNPHALYVAEIFTLPSAKAQELLDQDLSGTELHALVVAALKDKTAVLDKLLMLRTLHGTRGKVDLCQHYEYPTEHDPPQIPQTLAIVNPAGAPKASASPAPAGKEVLSPFNAGLGTMTTGTPTAFETQPLGDTLEVETTEAVSQYALQSTALVSVGQTSGIPLPVFSTRKLQGKAHLTSGQAAFLGSYDVVRPSGVPKERTDATTALAFLTSRTDHIPPKPQDKPATTETPQLRFVLEVVSLETSTACMLMQEQTDDAKLHDQVTALMGSQQAKRETMLTVCSTAGVRAKVENADNHASAVEFDPPQLPQTLILANRELLADMRSGKQTGIGARPPMEGVNPNGGFGLITTVSPTAFERVPLGESLEIESGRHGNIVYLTLAAEIWTLAGNVRYTGIDHPVTEKRTLQTEVNAELGRPLLLGTLSRPLATGFEHCAQENRTWLAFISVTEQ